MRAMILGGNSELSTQMEAEPTHSQDFCDSCGECLHCYRAIPCLKPYGARPAGNHHWIVYAADLAAWLRNHPEAWEVA